MNKYFQVDDFIIEVMLDIDSHCVNPRENCNLGTFYHWSSDYMSPDRCKYSKKEFLKKYNDKNSVILSVSVFNTGYSIKYFFEEGLNKDLNSYIFVEKDKIREEYNCKRVTSKIREKVIKVLSLELEEYYEWANGHVYGYIKYNLNDTEQVDSCWGFIGEDVFENGIIDNVYPTLFVKELGLFYDIEDCIKSTKPYDIIDFFFKKYEKSFQLKKIDDIFIELNYKEEDINISEIFYKEEFVDEFQSFIYTLRRNNQEELLKLLSYDIIT